MTELSDYRRIVETPMLAKKDAEIARLRAALEPFAKAGAEIPADWPDGMPIRHSRAAAAIDK